MILYIIVGLLTTLGIFGWFVWTGALDNKSDNTDICFSLLISIVGGACWILILPTLLIGFIMFKGVNYIGKGLIKITLIIKERFTR